MLLSLTGFFKGSLSAWKLKAPFLSSSSGQPRIAWHITPRRPSLIDEGQESIDKLSLLSHFLVGNSELHSTRFQSVHSRTESQAPRVCPSAHPILAFSLPPLMCLTSLLFIQGPLFKHMTCTQVFALGACGEAQVMTNRKFQFLSSSQIVLLSVSSFTGNLLMSRAYLWGLTEFPSQCRRYIFCLGIHSVWPILWHKAAGH